MLLTERLRRDRQPSPATSRYCRENCLSDDALLDVLDCQYSSVEASTECSVVMKRPMLQRATLITTRMRGMACMNHIHQTFKTTAVAASFLHLHDPANYLRHELQPISRRNYNMTLSEL